MPEAKPAEGPRRRPDDLGSVRRADLELRLARCEAQPPLCRHRRGQFRARPTPTPTPSLSFDLDTGKILWAHQATSDDVYNSGCAPGRETGQELLGPDGLSRRRLRRPRPSLQPPPTERTSSLQARRSGSMWAMNPDNGEVVWRTALGHGTAMGGIHLGHRGGCNASSMRRSPTPAVPFPPIRPTTRT